MNKFTLDTNCIIDLEENRPDAPHLRKLIQKWKEGTIELAVVAVSASENQLDGTASRNFSVFEERLKGAGLAGVHHLLPLAKWDVFYWDHALWSGEEMEKLESDIRHILFPGIQTELPDDIGENSDWRNQLCDVLVAWSHAFHDWDFLVTRDSNFHDKKPALKQVGIKDVVHPKDAVQLCSP